MKSSSTNPYADPLDAVGALQRRHDRFCSRSDVDYDLLWQHFRHKGEPAEQQFHIRENYAASISELLIITALIALAFSLVTNLGLMGALVLFMGAITFSRIGAARLKEGTQIRFWNQFLWGWLLPPSCLVAAAGLAERDASTQLYSIDVEILAAPASMWIYLAFLLIVSWFVSPYSMSWVNTLLAGQFLTGAFFLTIIGFVLIPFTLIGSLAMVGLIGLTPFISGIMFLRTGWMHYEWAGPYSLLKGLSVFIGFCVFAFVFFLLMFLSSSGFFDGLLPMKVISQNQPQVLGT
jgi:hypothetical protein